MIRGKTAEKTAPKKLTKKEIEAEKARVIACAVRPRLTFHCDFVRSRTEAVCEISARTSLRSTLLLGCLDMKRVHGAKVLKYLTNPHV
jgi:hypothetical protein